MKPECESAVRAAAGDRKLSDADIRAIETRLQSSTKAVRRADPTAWQGMNPTERLKAAAKHARETHLDQIARGHATSVQRMQMLVRRQALYDSIEPTKQVDAIIHNTFEVHGNSTMTPTESLVRALQREAGTRFTGAEERLMRDPTKADAFADELAGKDSGDAQVKALAAKAKGVSDDFLEQLRLAGVNITDLENYRSPQPWDWTRVRDLETFVQDALGWMDPREFTNPDGTQQSPEQLRHTLEAAHRTIATNGANKRAAGAQRPGSNVAAKYAATRQLHFKDGASWLAAMRKYGTSEDIYGILHEHWARMARDVAVAQQHGPSASTDFHRQVDRAEDNGLAAATTEKQKRYIARRAKLAKAQWDVLTRGSSPGNTHIAGWMGVIRSIMSASKLGVMTSQFPSDPLMAMNFLKAVGMRTGPFMRDMAAGLKGSGDRAQFARVVGAWQDSAHEGYARFGDTEVLNGVSRFLNKTVYVRSGMRAADRGVTVAQAVSYYNTLGEAVASGKSFDALGAAHREFLAQQGFNPELWDGVMRKADASKILDGDDRAFVTPESIYNIPDEALRPLAEKRVAGTNDALKARIKEINASTEKEAGWTAARQQKLDDLRQRVTTAIKALEAKESVRAGGAEGVAAARAEVLRAHVAQAEVEASNAHYLDVRDQHNRMSDAIDSVLHDDQLASMLQKFAHTVGTNGEKIGSLRAAAEARIKAAEKTLADKESAAGAKIDEKSNAADKLIAKHAKDLAGFTKEMRNRAARREDLLGAYRKHVGRAVADETARIKHEVVGNMLGGFDNVLHAAGRGYARSTISERQRLQLNQTEPGTFMGEALRMAYMIRQVPFGMAMTHLHDIPAGMNGWAPRAQYVARYMLGQAIATGAGLQMKHIISGEDPEDVTSWKFAGKMLAGAGFGPMIATLLFGSGGEHQDWGGKILGPGGEAVTTLAEIGSTARDDLSKEGNVDWGKVGNRVTSFARSNAVPFMNFWYTKSAFNHLIYQQLQEAVSPGYNERVQQRLKERQTSQFWQNGQALPQRAPDVGAAIGQPTQ